MSQERQGDLILPQGTYALVQDGAGGNVDVVVGPNKTSLADTDRPVIYDHNTRRYITVAAKDAIQTNPAAGEGQYIILSNPTIEGDGKKYPSKGKQNAAELNNGHKINIPGPYTMPLYPGQSATVLDGHNLNSNQYLIVRVYNEDAARKNLKHAVVKENTQEKLDNIEENDIVIGKLFVIKGTSVSFYIPPTGMEVIKHKDTYVRNAVTLERLEYCILKDQNGDKRFVQGPAVVFPKPTEMFIEQNGTNQFKAIELNENMGIYVKIIADYKEEREYKSGDELFITGKEQKIYFPRPEHAIIKYGEQIIHYATAVPTGEARYILNKNTGEVELKSGPVMLLPDPRTHVIVKRALDEKTVRLWFPGNDEALNYNRSLGGQLLEQAGMSIGNDMHRTLKSTVRFAAVADEMQRSESYTKPRSITLDTKYEGAVRINVWPGYAVQVVKKTGERSLVVGPNVKLLAYDEDLEALELSTGKPKTDNNLMRTVYLQTKNNIVSDIIEAETSDSVEVSIRISYRVNFLDTHQEKWFNVSNYVKLLTQNLRSIVRNKVKKTNIEDFNRNAADIIRDLILGPSVEGKREGRLFDENGMQVYDVEVLQIKIGDAEVAELLKDAQIGTVKHKLDIQAKQQSYEYTVKTHELTRSEIEEKHKTEEMQKELRLQHAKNDQELELTKKQNEVKIQEVVDVIEKLHMERQVARTKQQLAEAEHLTDLHNKRMEAIQPKLIEALITLSNNSFAQTLAANLKSQNDSILGLFPEGGFQGLMNTIAGSPLEARIKSLVDNKMIHSGEELDK